MLWIEIVKTYTYVEQLLLFWTKLKDELVDFVKDPISTDENKTSN